MLRLLLVIHNHQPLGNLPEVFRKAYDIAYAPFLDVVRRHPGIKWALHASGCLWEWFEKEEPGYMDALRVEHSAGRLEFLTGGMWEPIQPLLHETSCRFQFKGMRDFLKDRFGVDPIGSWTTERVWEPVLAARLADAGIRYTLLDDSQLRAGLPPADEDPVWGYYRTEHNEKSIAIFPIDESLRYFIPFHKADEVVRYLEGLAGKLPNDAAITYGDDGEKFGLWPETYEWVYEKGWLDEFLGRIEESKVITTTHPSKYMELMPRPRRRVYVPTSSYREMGIWTLYPRRNLGAEQIHRFVEKNEELSRIGPPHAAGFFRNFLARYLESRYMHERVAELIRGIVAQDPNVEPSHEKDAAPLQRALWHALRAQCNCAYWHGVFGGLYLNYLRFAVHREVLAAEKAFMRADSPPKTIRFLGTRHVDSEKGVEIPEPESAVLVATERVHWVIDPVTGQIIAAGDLEREIDVIDVLARRPEAYHATMKESDEIDEAAEPASIHDMVEIAPPGWRDGHGYDECRRGCFADRVIDVPPSLDRLARVEYTVEVGPLCGFWDTRITGNSVELTNTHGPWRREKTFSLDNQGSTAIVHYRLSRSDHAAYNGFLLLEFNLGLLAGEAPDRYHLLPSGERLPLASDFELDGVSEAIAVDEWSNVRITCQVDGADWLGVYPVKTLSRSEGGLEMTYQGTSLVFRVPIKLGGGSAWNSGSRMTIEPNR